MKNTNLSFAVKIAKSAHTLYAEGHNDGETLDKHFQSLCILVCAAIMSAITACKSSNLDYHGKDKPCKMFRSNACHHEFNVIKGILYTDY